MNIDIIRSFVEQKLRNEATGHDILHAERVRSNAMSLVVESVDTDVVQAAALVHDLIDDKLDDQHRADWTAIRAVLTEAGLHSHQVISVRDIIHNMSFRTGKTPTSWEGKIVQDADRLDALGAIGIARVFSFGGRNGRMIYDPDSLDGSDSISHFHQKLLRLADTMNTKLATDEAKRRTRFMMDYLAEFNRELATGEV